MEPIFHRVLADMEGFSPEELPGAREITSFLSERLDATTEHMEVLQIYHAVRQLSYDAHPDNRQYTDFLSNNKDRFNISSYFDIPASPTSVLGKWSLPEELQGNVVLDTKRQWVVDKVINGNPKENFVIIGEPGVGKTVILFEIFDMLMKEGNAGILTTENISDYHEGNGIKMFYDDLPENRPMIQALKEAGAKGVVVSARLEDWKEQCKGLDTGFTRLSIPTFNREKMNEVSGKLLDLTNIYRDQEAVDLLVKYAEGTPIYVWLLIKEMKNTRQKELTVNYLRRHASKGMINYVGDLLHRLLKDGPDFKKGGYHTLTMLYFLSTYMTNKQCHAAYFREVSDGLDKYTTDILQSDFDRTTQSRVMYYLSGGGDIMRFPHDAWADVLAKKGKQNPFIQNIIYIEEDIADTDIFDRVMLECIPSGWNRMQGRYKRMPNRTRESFLKFGECLLSNFRPSTLKEQGIDLDYLRELAIQHSDLESSKVILSKLEHLGKTKTRNVINIQKMSGGHIGDNKEDIRGLSPEAMREKRRYEETRAREETERRRIDRDERWDEKVVEMTIGDTDDSAGSDGKALVIKAPEDEAKESFEKLKKLYEKGKKTGMDISGYAPRYRKIRSWMNRRNYEKARYPIQGLLVELEDELTSHEEGLKKELDTVKEEIDRQLDICAEKGVGIEDEENAFVNAEDSLKDGELIKALGELRELGMVLKKKLSEHDSVARKCKELFAELSKLAGNEFGLLPPPELEDNIRDDPFRAEADVARYRESIEAERKRRRKEAEERDRQRKRALELNERLNGKVDHCRKEKFNVFLGFNDRRGKVRDLLRSHSYETAIGELRSLISDLDEHVKNKEIEAKGWRKEGDDWVNCIGMKFKKIPGKSYSMGKFTVTQKEWKAVMGATPWKGESYVREGDDYPATYISWNDCQQFVKKLNSKEGRNRYRLPTEEEWEHACRAGSTTEYCFGDDAGRLGEYAWYEKNADEDEWEYPHADHEGPQRVGQKKPNKWGLYDMHGNVWEWCQDWYDDEHKYRVLRGGCWSHGAEVCASAIRFWHPELRYYFLGFRLVRSSDR